MLSLWCMLPNYRPVAASAAFMLLTGCTHTCCRGRIGMLSWPCDAGQRSPRSQQGLRKPERTAWSLAVAWETPALAGAAWATPAVRTAQAPVRLLWDHTALAPQTPHSPPSRLDACCSLVGQGRRGTAMEPVP